MISPVAGRCRVGGCSGIEGLAPLPGRTANGLVGHDHPIPAVTVELADPIDASGTMRLMTSWLYRLRWIDWLGNRARVSSVYERVTRESRGGSGGPGGK